jgi:hypothetical protein
MRRREHLLKPKTRFWRSQQLNGYAFGEDAAEVWESTFEQSGTHGILQNYLRGGYALDLMKKPESGRTEYTLEKLAKLFPELRSNLCEGSFEVLERRPVGPRRVGTSATGYDSDRRTPGRKNIFRRGTFVQPCFLDAGRAGVGPTGCQRGRVRTYHRLTMKKPFSPCVSRSRP